jgi:integrase
LRPLKFHELRHSFVALSVAAGADPKQVSVRAGHASVAFTLDQYGHLYEDGEDRVTAALDALLEQAQPTPDAGVRRLGL